MRNRSGISLHTLRVGIKRFRYIVENFLPVEHKLWSDDLKHMQDLLGEVHDLDVLWATALSCRVFTDQASRDAWHARIQDERAKRTQEYRKAQSEPILFGTPGESLPRETGPGDCGAAPATMGKSVGSGLRTFRTCCPAGPRTL